MWFGFFFQAEDGRRDADVTGVQTCALPILPRLARAPAAWGGARKWNGLAGPPQGLPRVDTQHSRLSSARSADANHSRTSPENSTYGPAVAISAPIPRP